MLIGLLAQPALAEGLKYSLTLDFDATTAEISTRLTNQSDRPITLKEDELPSSLDVFGIRLHAFTDTKELEPVPILWLIAHNPRKVTVAPGEFLEGVINARRLFRDYCDLLKESPVLVFWLYSARSNDDVLWPVAGVVRLEWSKQACPPEGETEISQLGSGYDFNQPVSSIAGVI